MTAGPFLLCLEISCRAGRMVWLRVWTEMSSLSNCAEWKMAQADLIAAVATPPGDGGLAVIRVSGPGAVTLVGGVFRGTVPLDAAPGYSLHFGRLVDPAGDAVDDVVVAVFRAPHSYTGEEVVEVSCHGGRHVAEAVLDVFLSLGVRPASPGEFTKRAFLNGRMDLAQAEAVADLIAARGSRAHRISLDQLHGRLSDGISGLRKRLLDVCALLELDLDFADEGLDVARPAEIREAIAGVDAELKRLEDSFTHGRLIHDGVLVVLAGLPNAGKSSLFNALLRQERAIVTHIPGTTRDSLEELISIEGITFKLIDTAGLRSPDNVAEEMGIARSISAVQSADVILYVVDASVPHTAGEIPEAVRRRERWQHIVLAKNKVDMLGEVRDEPELLSELLKPSAEVFVSATTGAGLDTLRRALVESVGFAAEAESLPLTNRRHLDAVKKGREALSRGLNGLLAGLTNEFVAADIREGARALGEITGELTSEDVLNDIFSRFCVGK